MCAMTGATRGGRQRGGPLSGKRSQTDGDAFIFDAPLPLCVPLSSSTRNWPEKAGQNWHVPI